MGEALPAMGQDLPWKNFCALNVLRLIFSFMNVENAKRFKRGEIFGKFHLSGHRPLSTLLLGAGEGVSFGSRG